MSLRTRLFVPVAVLSLLLLPPILRPPVYVIHVFIVMFLYGALAISWHILSGYTNYLSFGHAAYFGIGAYSAGLLLVAKMVPIPVAVLAGGAMAGLAGLALGFSCMRLRGYYFSIASLMLVFIAYVVFVNITDIIPGTRMEIWLPVPPLAIFDYRLSYYYVFFVYLFANAVFSIWTERSKFGYGLRAIKDDEDIAETVGVRTTRLKATASAVSAFSAGIIGATYAQYLSYIDVSIFFDVLLSFNVIFMSFFGGIGTWLGPLVASFILVPANEVLTMTMAPEVARIFYGVLFIVVVLLLPDGLVGLYRRKTMRGSSNRS